MIEIKNPVKLGFNPSNENTSQEVKDVFDNKFARILWLSIKQQHLTDQYFNKNCLDAGERLEKGVKNEDQLRNILFIHFNTNYEKGFLKELFPYICNQKNLEYEVINN